MTTEEIKKKINQVNRHIKQAIKYYEYDNEYLRYDPNNPEKWSKLANVQYDRAEKIILDLCAECGATCEIDYPGLYPTWKLNSRNVYGFDGLKNFFVELAT